MNASQMRVAGGMNREVEYGERHSLSGEVRSMEAHEALGIIAALANGVHPFTGEVFPAGGPYQHPDVVRALFAATRALEGRSRQLDRQRDLPANVGKPWTAEEDARLLAAFDSGQPRTEIARAHDRTVGGIEARLEKFGRLAPGESGVRLRGRTLTG
jgi:hypothetical protein